MAISPTDLTNTVNSQIGTKNSHLQDLSGQYVLLVNENQQEQTIVNTDTAKLADINSQIAALNAQKAALVDPHTESFTLGLFQGGNGTTDSSYSDAKGVELTGTELTALKSSLSKVTSANIKGDYQSVLNDLKSQGINNASLGADGKSIVFTEANGKTTKIYDANGNGGLDTEDYNFNKALTDFNKEMTSYNAKVSEIDGKVNTLQASEGPITTELNTANAQLTLIGAQINSNLSDQDSTNADLTNLTAQLNGTSAHTDPTQHVTATGDQNADNNGTRVLIPA